MIEKYLPEIIIALFGVVLILIIIVIILQQKVKKLKQKFDIFTFGLDGINLEKILLNIQKDIKDIETGNILREDKISQIETALNFTIRKIGIVRYNAFLNKEQGRGGELSFSICFLDGFNNGFVLSSIYTSQTSVTYAKSIRNLKSDVPLSDEEMLAIEKAIKG